MNSKKIKVAILFGGRSTEHKISLLSAQNVIKAIDKQKFDPILIGIDKSGQWYLNEASIPLLQGQSPDQIKLAPTDEAPILFSQNTDHHQLVRLNQPANTINVDVIFPMLHGLYGEDGSVQGLAKLANIPCVGCGVLGSAVGMDKDIMKHILRSNNIATANWVTVRDSESAQHTYTSIKDKLGSHVFIKPANQGSSVGVFGVNSETEFNDALPKSLQYDHKVIIEERIIGREIEVAVMGNQEPKASLPGEIVPKEGFYSYENKYIDADGAALLIPAPMSEKQMKEVQAIAIKTYKALECRGLARVDLFMTEDSKLIINEINTIPGFTNISMYPKMWEATGLNQTDLISQLIEYSIEEHIALNNLKC